jgi:hypothetical protein
MIRRTFREVAIGCAVLLPASGCYTGAGRAESRRELVKSGMTQDEVREVLGEPDAVTTLRPHEEPEPVVEWSYAYTTPFTMYIPPTIGLLTIVFTVPSLQYIFGLSMGIGRLRVEFGPDLKVLRAITDMQY